MKSSRNSTQIPQLELQRLAPEWDLQICLHQWHSIRRWQIHKILNPVWLFSSEICSPSEVFTSSSENPIYLFFGEKCGSGSTKETWDKILQVPPGLALELLRIIKPATGPTWTYSSPFSFHCDRSGKIQATYLNTELGALQVQETTNKQEILNLKSDIKGWSHKNTTILNTMIENLSTQTITWNSFYQAETKKQRELQAGSSVPLLNKRKR